MIFDVINELQSLDTQCTLEEFIDIISNNGIEYNFLSTDNIYIFEIGNYFELEVYQAIDNTTGKQVTIEEIFINIK